MFLTHIRDCNLFLYLCAFISLYPCLYVLFKISLFIALIHGFIFLQCTSLHLQPFKV